MKQKEPIFRGKKYTPFPSQPQGQWKTFPPGAVYISPIRGFERFVGRRPVSHCHDYTNSKTCQDDLSCIWIPTQHYCRSYPSHVSGGYSKQVYYAPRYPAGSSSCVHQSKEDCIRNGCKWIQWFTETGEGSAFCKGGSYSTTPYSTNFYAHSR